ncbi:MAG: SAM-dependent methyltransferase [Bacteroidia bacterium]
MQDWFRSWFDSPYYHILYKNRNEAEAQLFLNNIINYLKPKASSKMLDQACGKGRHAKYLSSLGFDVTGIDLSRQSIDYCRKYENDRLHFYVHDMRSIFRTDYFDFVFNIFTSIGYFKNDLHQQMTVDSAATALKKNGKYIVDFMNAAKVISELKPVEKITSEKINFNIQKRVENNFIMKKIQFEDGGKNYEFEETVEAIELKDFERYFSHAGLIIKDVFGNYHLESFNEENSERLIIIAEKINKL